MIWRVLIFQLARDSKSHPALFTSSSSQALRAGPLFARSRSVCAWPRYAAPVDPLLLYCNERKSLVLVGFLTKTKKKSVQASIGNYIPVCNIHPPGVSHEIFLVRAAEKQCQRRRGSANKPNRSGVLNHVRKDQLRGERWKKKTLLRRQR